METIFNKKDLTVMEFEENYYEIRKKYGGIFEDTYNLIKNVKTAMNIGINAFLTTGDALKEKISIATKM